MAIVYRIYSNGGTAGPVDYSTPIGTTGGLSFTIGPVGISTDTRYAVRAFDNVTGLEEANTDAVVRLVIGANGADLSARPNPPHAVTTSPAGGGSCRVRWAYAPAAPYGVPSGFHVSIQSSAAAGPPALAATVAYRGGVLGYSAVLPGPFGPANYTATVAAFNASGESLGVTETATLPGPPATAYDLGPVSVFYL